MTQNQIKVLELKEKHRSNLAQESLGKEKNVLEKAKFLTDMVYRPIETVNQSMSATGSLLKGAGSLTKVLI